MSQLIFPSNSEFRTRKPSILVKSVVFILLVSSTSISEDSNYDHLKFDQLRFSENDFSEFMKGKNGFFDLESPLLKGDLICGVLTTRTHKDAVDHESYCYAYDMSLGDISLLHIDWERNDFEEAIDFTGIFCISPDIYGVEIVERKKRFESNQRLLFIWNRRTEKVDFQHHHWGHLGSFAQHLYNDVDSFKLFHQKPRKDQVLNKGKNLLPFAKLAIVKDNKNLAVDIPDFALKIKHPNFLSRFQMITPVLDQDHKLNSFIITTSLIDELYQSVEFDERKMIRHFDMNGELLWKKSTRELEVLFGTEIYAIAAATQPISDDYLIIVIRTKDAKKDQSLRYFGVVDKRSGAIVNSGEIQSGSEIVPLIASQDARRIWIERNIYDYETGIKKDILGIASINVPFGINENDVIYAIAFSHKNIVEIKSPWKESKIILRLD